MIGSHSARQHSPTSPWRGEVGERSKNASRVGVKLNHPTPAARKMLAADPPRPGEGEARVMLSSEPITRIPYQPLSCMTEPGCKRIRASLPSAAHSSWGPSPVSLHHHQARHQQEDGDHVPIAHAQNTAKLEKQRHRQQQREIEPRRRIGEVEIQKDRHRG